MRDWSLTAKHLVTPRAVGCIDRTREAKSLRRSLREIPHQNLGNLRRSRESAAVWAPKRPSGSAPCTKLVQPQQVSLGSSRVARAKKPSLFQLTSQHQRRCIPSVTLVLLGMGIEIGTVSFKQDFAFSYWIRFDRRLVAFGMWQEDRAQCHRQC